MITWDRITLENNPSLRGLARIERDIVYSDQTGQTLTLITPWQAEGAAQGSHPVIVFLQGSSWTSPDLDYEIPQLSRYAQQGYVVATLTHRDSSKGHPFPAYLQDTKTAIRFLRANAERFDIDPGRVAMFGTSSGGNTALLVGLTANDPRYQTEEFASFSDDVQTVIACFAPCDIPAMVMEQYDLMAQHPAFEGLVGGGDPMAVARGMSPILEIKEGADYPPILLAHGDADETVPFDQSERMYHALKNAGHQTRLIRVTNAPHEGSFWSRRLHELLQQYLEETLSLT